MRAPLHAQLDAHDDDFLVARLRAGDDVAFGALVDRHRPWLVRLCTRLLDYDTHAAEDAAQESLLKLHTAARRDGRPLRVRPWLTVVARHTCVDQQRRRRPDLPGELPDRAVAADDPFPDTALTEAWSRLSGRHREVLYLREVLGFSYKEIGAVMDLTLPATETLVFRARAALRREYERSGGTSFGVGLLGLRLARLGVGRRPDTAVSEGLSNAVATDGGGLSGLATRLIQWVSSIPGYGEPMVAKALSAAAGVAVAAAAVLPGLGPLGRTPPASAAGAAPVAVASGVTAVKAAVFAPPAGGVASLEALLGNAVPAGWAPHRSRSASAASGAASPAPAPLTGDAPRLTPLRDAAAARPADGPRLARPVRRSADSDGPIRSLLPDQPPPVVPPERPHPLRSLLADPVPLPLDPDPGPPPVPAPGSLLDPWPAGTGPEQEPPPAPPVPTPAPDDQPLRDAVAPSTGALVTTVAGDDGSLLRRRDG